MNTFVFAGDELRRLRDTLLAASPMEAAAILLAGRAETPIGTRLLVHEAIFAPPDAYYIQEASRISLAPQFIAPLLKRARNEGWSLIFVHTHPFGDKIRFSVMDDEGERLLMPSLFARADSRPHGSLVLGRSGFDARIWRTSDPSAISVPVTSLLETGRDINLFLRDEQRPIIPNQSSIEMSVL